MVFAQERKQSVNVKDLGRFQLLTPPLDIPVRNKDVFLKCVVLLSCFYPQFVFLFLLKLKWPKKKSLYGVFYFFDNTPVNLYDWNLSLYQTRKRCPRWPSPDGG